MTDPAPKATTRGPRLWQLFLLQAAGFIVVWPVIAAFDSGHWGMSDFQVGALVATVLLRLMDAAFAYQHKEIV